MKVCPAILIVLIALLPNTGNSTYLENLCDFSVLGDLSKAVVELEVKTLKGDSQKASFTLIDDSYQELTKYRAKNPFSNTSTKTFSAGLILPDLEFSVFQGIKSTSYKNLNLTEQSLWVDPNIFSFDIQVLKTAGSTSDLVTLVLVKVKDEVVASGLVKDKNNLKMDKKPYIDGNQQLQSVSITSDQLASNRRYFEMDLEMNRALEKQKFRVKIDLNKISFTSRLSSQDDLEEDSENTL